MTRRVPVLLAVAVLLSGAGPADATDLRNVLTDYVLTSWNNKEGLPPGVVNGLVQDRDGYLWVGSDAGLFRFDGARFVAWNARTSPALPELPVRSLILSQDGTMWAGFGGTGGVGRIADGRLEMYGEKEGLEPGVVSMLVQDARGAIWAGNTQGLYRFANGRWERRRLRPDNDVIVYSAYVDAQGTLFFGTSAGLFREDLASTTFELVAGSADAVRAIAEDGAGRMWLTDSVTGFRTVGASRSVPSVDRGRGMRLLRDRRGNMWVATGGQGLWRVQPKQGVDSPPTIERATSLTGLLGDGVYALIEDRDGNLWAGTTEGLNRLTPRKISQIIDLGIVRGVETTPDASVWVGTVDGLVQFTAAGVRREWRPDGARLNALYVDERGTLWVATPRQLLRFIDGRPSIVPVPSSYALDQIELITSDSKGGVWLYDSKQGLMHWANGKLSRVSGGTDLQQVAITSAYTDRGGHIWLALSNGKVARVAADESLELYGEQDGLNGGIYDTFHEDERGVLWIGASAGVSRYQGGRFVTLRASERFPATSVVAITSDTNDSLWIGSSAGIVRIERHEFEKALATPSYPPHVLVYDRSDGIAGVPVALGKSHRVVRSKDGRLWFVTARGITVINPRELPQPRTPSPVRIEEAFADGRPLQTLPQWSLSAGVRRLEIDYTVINLTSALKTRFRYRLDGFDTDWIEADARRQVFYTNLPPGKYFFRVSASDAGGGWAEPGDEWEFSIAPMFYQTGWFYTACSLMLVIAFGAAWQWRLHHVRHEFSLLLGERTRLSREIHDTLLQSLVGVALQCDSMASDLDASPAKRSEFVRMRKQVEEYIREARQAIWDLRSTRLEQRDLMTALRETAVNAVNGQAIQLDFTMTGPPQPGLPRIEAEMLKIGQEAVLNAVHHAHPSRIAVELIYGEGAMTLRVSDDGCGFDQTHVTDDHHYGLISMKERAAVVGGQLTVEASSDHGTAVTAVIPMPHHL